MSERVAGAARFTREIDEQRKRCSEKDCVNWKCDGTRHRNYKGDKWGDGWREVPTVSAPPSAFDVAGEKGYFTLGDIEDEEVPDE